MGIDHDKGLTILDIFRRIMQIQVRISGNWYSLIKMWFMNDVA